MNKIYLSVISTILVLFGQSQNLTTTPNGGNKKSFVMEQVGLTNVSVSYDKPAVKGREGKIWGALVHYGFKDLGYGTAKASPWRAGANENTIIEFSNDVKVEGQLIPAGKYGFFIDVEPDHCVLIFNKRTTSWGSYFYDPKEDILKVNVKQQPQDKSTEWLKYEFSDETTNSAILSLIWEKWKIPFKIETDLLKDQMDIFRSELTSSKGGEWKTWNYAAKYALDHNYNLNEALIWSDRSINLPYIGEKNFTTLSTRAGLLDKMGRKAEAEAAIKDGLPMASKQELFSYGVSLIKQKDFDKAFSVMKMGYDKYPNQYISSMGLARVYSAKGDYDKALKYANEAKKLAPDTETAKAIDDKISMLQKKTDIN